MKRVISLDWIPKEKKRGSNGTSKGGSTSEESTVCASASACHKIQTKPPANQRTVRTHKSCQTPSHFFYQCCYSHDLYLICTYTWIKERQTFLHSILSSFLSWSSSSNSFVCTTSHQIRTKTTINISCVTVVDEICSSFVVHLLFSVSVSVSVFIFWLNFIYVIIIFVIVIGFTPTSLRSKWFLGCLVFIFIAIVIAIAIGYDSTTITI